MLLGGLEQGVTECLVNKEVWKFVRELNFSKSCLLTVDLPTIVLNVQSAAGGESQHPRRADEYTTAYHKFLYQAKVLDTVVFMCMYSQFSDIYAPSLSKSRLDNFL